MDDMLVLVEEQQAKRDAQKLLKQHMIDSMKFEGVRTIGFPGHNAKGTVYYNGVEELWCAFGEDEQAKIPRRWNAFGVYHGGPGAQSVTLEVNIPTTTNSAKVEGFFARDTNAQAIYLMHTGGVGGGKRGVGRSAFRVWSNRQTISVTCTNGEPREGFVIGRVNAPDFADRVWSYVQHVRAFKDAVDQGEMETPDFKRRLAEWESYRRQNSGSPTSRAMRYWWVNQNQTYKHEVEGGFLWSPIRSKGKNGGSRNQFYENMTSVRRGDLVLSFCDAQIKAVGVAQGSAEASSKPEFGNAGKQWSDEGWLVMVDFTPVENPVRPKDFIDELRPHLAAKYAPLQDNGNGNQGVYLAEVTANFAEIVLAKMGLMSAKQSADAVSRDDADNQEDQAASSIAGRTDIGATQIKQLINARRGQGIFKVNVRLNEKRCRVTGITDARLLIASHMKPWSKSDDQEKLDGCNGLLLSPHVDRLFDKGLISFEDDGKILKSSKLSDDVWRAWGLAGIYSVTPFSNRQAVYLAFHRTVIFKP